jgi:hypothetical protein
MTWKLKFMVLAIMSVPALTGYPLNVWPAEIVAGVSRAWVLYLLAAHAMILIVSGRRIFANVLAVASLIVLPVVFVGASISYLIYVSGLGYDAGPPAYSAHYVGLVLTMLTVIPLALNLIAVVPFQQVEYTLLRRSSGVSKPEKALLMCLRVFNHIVYGVIPNILETIREEGYFRYPAARRDPKNRPGAAARLRGLMRIMIQLGVEGICASIQYVPLWAVEISSLPSRSAGRRST